MPKKVAKSLVQSKEILEALAFELNTTSFQTMYRSFVVQTSEALSAPTTMATFFSHDAEGFALRANPRLR